MRGRPAEPERAATPQVTGTMALAATVERLTDELRAVREDLQAQALAALAKGVLVERLRCGPAEAGRQLERLAADSRQTPAELAADIVGQAAGDAIARVSDVRSSAGTAADARRRSSDPADERPDGVGPRLRAAESAAMLAGQDTGAVVRAVLDHTLGPAFATAAALWAVAPDGSLTLAGEAGFGPAEAARWRYVPPGAGTLAQQAVTEQRTLWAADARRPPLTIGPGGGTRAVSPARAGARQAAVLEVRWPDSADSGPEPTPALRGQLHALADLCALTLADRHPEADPGTAGPAAWLAGLADGLLDSAMVLRPLRARDGRIHDFRIEHTNERFTDPAGRPGRSLTNLPLLDAYPLFALEGGLFDQIQRVYATGVPHRLTGTVLRVGGDRSPVAALAGVGLSRFGDAVLVTWRIEEGGTRRTALLRHAQRLSRIGGFEENLVTGEVTWSEEVYAMHGLPPGARPLPLNRLGGHAHPDDTTAIGRFLRTVLHKKASDAVTFRLRRADGVTRHVRVVAEPLFDASGLLAVRGAYQDVSSQRWTEVALAATRDRLAGAEQQAAERHRLARQLQQAILPPADQPVHTPGLQVAVRYRAAEEDNRVGGDWYDAVILPDRHVLLTVGDVAGHSITAANGMVVLRNALRGLAVTGAGPGQLLSWLNDVAHDLTDDVTGTAVCGIFDPDTGALCWARAGHPPPVLVRGGSAEALPTPHGPLLGAVAGSSYEELTLALRPRDTLLMYTDGLIERRDSSVQDAVDHLLAAASRPVENLDRFLDHLLATSTADTGDDTCLVGIQPH